MHETSETSDVPAWPSGRRAALSLTFDDARHSQITRGIPILDRFDVKGTFYVMPNMVERDLDGWRRAVANGHEIGNHSMTHPCSGNFSFARRKGLEDYTLADMEGELSSADEAIRRLLGVTTATFAYPCGQKFVGRGVNVRSYVPLIAGRYIAGRGFPDEWHNDPLRCDLAQAFGYPLDGLTFAQARTQLDKAVEEDGWLIFAGHEVGSSGHQTVLETTLADLCAYAADSANGIWLDTVANVGAHVRKRQQST